MYNWSPVAILLNLNESLYKCQWWILKMTTASRMTDIGLVFLVGKRIKHIKIFSSYKKKKKRNPWIMFFILWVFLAHSNIAVGIFASLMYLLQLAKWWKRVNMLIWEQSNITIGYSALFENTMNKNLTIDCTGCYPIDIDI
jgi:hypothetical protein